MPAGWEPYTDFSCAQPFYVPSGPEHFPEPIEWVPCPPSSGLAAGCRMMKIGWKGSGSLIGNAFDVDASGRASLLFARVFDGPGNGHAYNLVAEADGPVRTAILSPRVATAGFLLLNHDLNENRFVLQALGGEGKRMDAFDSERKAVLLGTVGEPRPKLFRFDKSPLTFSYRISSKLLARGEGWAGRITLLPLDGAPPSELWSSASDPEGLHPDMPTLIGDRAVFGVGSLMQQGIMAHDPSSGTHPLVRWYGDLKQGAYNVGTDGKDMVWTHGEDHPPGEGTYPTRSIMTSPFTTDPKQLKPKRLRSDPTQAFDVNFAVGCGYAAHDIATSVGLLVVRLADGVSWTLPNDQDSSTDGTTWIWQYVFGVTCDEVFGTVGTKLSASEPTVYTLVRMRLDALGPGITPD